MKLRLRKGLDIKLRGAVAADAPVVADIKVDTFAVCPDDYPGFVPKTAVHEGDRVAAGAPLLFDKNHPEVKLVSPVAGTVKAVRRGERRKILHVAVAADGTADAQSFDLKMPVVALMAASGLLAAVRRRPYDVVPDPDVRPRDIFITAFDSAPLAAPLELCLGQDAAKALGAAAKALAKATDGKIYFSHRDTWTLGPVPGTEDVLVSGPHPAGNVGIQMANIAPVNKGDTVWGMDVVTLYRLGHLLLTGELLSETVVAVVGPEVDRPALVATHDGAAVAPLLAGRLHKTGEHMRVISGNVLTGTAVDPADGFLHFPSRQITVIAEGDDHDEFMGWASISPAKLSVSRALPLRGLRDAYAPDARLNGGRRAMIMSGQYDRVVPMDILSEYLLKAFISRNIDDMEALGAYEVAPEDLALAEFVDTSKLPVQQIVRDGLDYLRKELE